MSDLVTSTALKGRLTRSSSGWILLALPVGIQRGLFQALDAPGAELPRRNGRVNTHISVIRPEELEAAGNPDINEIGKSFSFNLGRCVETNPIGWEEMDRVWFMQVTSPDLVKLRRSYGLSDLPKKGRKQLNFHMTVAVRRKGVLRQGEQTKQAEDAQEEIDIDRDEAWDAVPKIAVLSAELLQEAASRDAHAQLGNPGGSSFIENLGALSQLWDGRIMGIKNKPSALSSMLTLGILGAGLGYGGGRLAGGVLNRLPGAVADPSRMGRTGAIAGGLAGLAPGLLYAMGNRQAGKPMLTGAFLNDRYPEPLAKRSNAGAAFDADQFASLINQDPYVRQALNPRERAMATGLVMGAKHTPGRGSSPLVTPIDIARMAAGMGSGYLSGAIVGNTLGSLMGLPDPYRKKLIQGGTFAGAVKGILPAIYGAE